MSKVFVIPDVHLKPWIFEEATELLSKGTYDFIVFLGDLVDDWDQERNKDLYHQTFDAAVDFAKGHPETLWCYGNHDVSHLWEAMESGYSYYARELIVERTRELRDVLTVEKCAFMHRIDDVLFSHAGLVESFVERQFGKGQGDLDQMIEKINQMGESELWQNDSPIWARPQYGSQRLYASEIFQVVGHTPVHAPLLEGNLLTLDNFSTYRNGAPIGNERFVWIDTTDKTWHYA